MSARPDDIQAVGAVVMGVGPISAIGCGRNAFWDALLAGTPGFGPIWLCDTSGSASKIGAEVKDFRLENHYTPDGCRGFESLLLRRVARTSLRIRSREADRRSASRKVIARVQWVCLGEAAVDFPANRVKG